jgi:hypothetical protein
MDQFSKRLNLLNLIQGKPGYLKRLLSIKKKKTESVIYNLLKLSTLGKDEFTAEFYQMSEKFYQLSTVFQKIKKRRNTC